MLDCPHVVEPEPVREHDLIEGLVEELLFCAISPGFWQLMFVEDSKLHRVLLSCWRRVGSVLVTLGTTSNTKTATPAIKAAHNVIG